jgi:ATP-dependent DNA ligase
MRLKFIPPMKPKLVSKPPEIGEWIHEIKLDGYRTQVIIEGDEVRAFSSSGSDWSKKYRGIVEDARDLDVESAIIDGEAVVLNDAGLPDFSLMQSVVHRDPYAAVLGAFDLLYLNGRDLRNEGCQARRDLLAGIVKPNSRIQFSEALPGDGKSVFYLADRAGLEGIVSKRKDSRYRSGPTTDWLKTKSYTVSNLELLGVEREQGKPAFALMGEPGTRKYVGSAFISLNREMRERLWKRVQEHTGPEPKGLKKRPDTKWVEPGIRLQVKHLRGEHPLRHGSILGFSEDDPIP